LQFLDPIKEESFGSLFLGAPSMGDNLEVKVLYRLGSRNPNVWISTVIQTLIKSKLLKTSGYPYLWNALLSATMQNVASRLLDTSHETT
jgi:hypothetical protein